MRKIVKYIQDCSQNADFCAEYGITLRPLSEKEIEIQDEDLTEEELHAVHFATPKDKENYPKYQQPTDRMELLGIFIDSLTEEEVNIAEQRLFIRRLLLDASKGNN